MRTEGHTHAGVDTMRCTDLAEVVFASLALAQEADEEEERDDDEQRSKCHAQNGCQLEVNR